MLQRIAVRTREAEAHIVELHLTLPFRMLLRGLCSSFVRVVDGCFGADHLVNTVGCHTGAGQHDGHHGQHQEGHDDLHGVGDERDHLAHLHGAGVHGLTAEPDDEQAGAVHDKGHKGHHGHHGTVGEQLGAHQVFVGLVEALLLKLFTAEGAHRHDAGQNLAADKVQPVHQLLHDLEFRHGNAHQEEDEQQQNGHIQHNDPGKAGAAVQHMQHAANAQNGRIGHHTQQHHADELHLLDVVGGAGDEGCGGKVLDLRIGKPDDAGKGLPAQVAANGGGHAGGEEAHSNGHGRHQQGEAQHLAAYAVKVAHLHIVGNALCLVFQLHQQHGLTFEVLHQGIIQTGKRTGQLLLDGFAGEARHLAHSGKLGAYGVQIIGSGGDGFGIRGGALRGCRLHVGKAGHAHAALPGGGVRCLCGRHIQHDVRRGDGILQRGALVIGQVGAQLQHAVVLKIVPVGALERIGVLFAHQKREGIQRALAYRFRQGAFNAALLDAGVHDPAGVVRQRKITVRLHEQQREHHKTDSPVPGQLLENFRHGSVLPSLFFASREAFSARMASISAPRKAFICCTCSGVSRAITQAK